MYYVYVLLSGSDGGFYTGSTGDLKHRVGEHSEGLVETTRDRRREKYLKTGMGKRYLRSRLKEHLKTLD